MGASSETNIQNQQTPKMLPPRQQQRSGALQTSLSLVSLDPNLSDTKRGSPSESASSHGTWPVSNHHVPKKLDKPNEKERGENNVAEFPVVHCFNTLDKMSLRDVARERVDIISEQMKNLPDEFLEDLKNELRIILEGTSGLQHRDEFVTLQKLVQNRSDLTQDSLLRAHHSQLEIFVAIKMGIQAFMHPSISLSQTSLIEMFLYKRCRNIACQTQLPADDCSCEVCSSRNGFCNLCMCVICTKFDFEVNTCRWIGCDLCSHWTHTDCAIRGGNIGMGPCVKSLTAPSDLIFRCRACSKTSELMGWVRDVFQHCAIGWDRKALLRELDYVSRIFRGSEDSKGRKLFWMCEELIEKMKGGVDESTACKLILLFFQDLTVDSTKNPESDEGRRLIAPQEACNRIADVVKEAIGKMEKVADTKMQMCKQARLALDACDRELEDKAREISELKLDRQRKRQQVDELEKIVRLKHAEADMFQLKASEARREAERLQRTLVKSDKSEEEEYASRYLKLRLNEAEAEKQYIYEKIKLHESSKAGGSQGNDPSQTLMFNKIQEMLKSVYNVSTKTEGGPKDHDIP